MRVLRKGSAGVARGGRGCGHQEVGEGISKGFLEDEHLGGMWRCWERGLRMGTES